MSSADSKSVSDWIIGALNKSPNLVYKYRKTSDDEYRLGVYSQLQDFMQSEEEIQVCLNPINEWSMMHILQQYVSSMFYIQLSIDHPEKFNNRFELSLPKNPGYPFTFLDQIWKRARCSLDYLTIQFTDQALMERVIDMLEAHEIYALHHIKHLNSNQVIWPGTKLDKDIRSQIWELVNSGASIDAETGNASAQISLDGMVCFCPANTEFAE